MSAPPLDLRGDEAANLLSAVSTAALGTLDEVASSPATSVVGLEAFLRRDEVALFPPEAGGDLSALIETIRQAGRLGINTANGRALAYMPGSGLLSSAAAEMLAGVINAYTGVSATAPAMIAMERGVIRWMANVMGMPAGSGGLLSSGGSMSTISALACARHQHAAFKAERACLYVTDETHHCVAKAAFMLGLENRAVRKVATDDRLRMDPRRLKAMLAKDLADGFQPFCVVGNAGSTSTGAIDPLQELAAIARDHGLWFHVDAAYGGFFNLTSRGRVALSGIEKADSIVLDPHKSLFLPYGTGALLVREERTLRDAHSVDGGAYLRDLDGAGHDFADLSPELSRPNRGLSLWLPLHLHGIAAFRAALDEKLDLADRARTRLSTVDGIELHPGSDLSVIAFRAVARDSLVADEMTDRIVRHVNATGEIFLASTRLRGRVYGRVAVLGLRTSAAHVHRAVELIAQGAKIEREREAIA